MEYIRKLRERIKEDPGIKYHPLVKEMSERELDDLITAAIYRRVSDRISETVRKEL